MGSGLFSSREVPLPLTRDEIGLYLDRTVLSQRKSENICVPSVVQLGAATPMLLSRLTFVLSPVSTEQEPPGW